jgi:hypothetical protein
MPVTIMHSATQDPNWFVYAVHEEATPTSSYYICCKVLPTVITFGGKIASDRHQVELSPENFDRVQQG